MKKLLFAIIFVTLGVCAQGQENRPPARLIDLNVEQMMPAYFFAHSGPGDGDGLRPSDNYAKALTPDLAAPEGVVSLIARPYEVAVFNGRYRGLKVLLVNGTNERVNIAAANNLLDIVQEALDADGKWRPVEYLPFIMCGNSYQALPLGPKEYWEFAAARYNGNLQTKLRFRFDLPIYRGEKMTLYSNEFDGSVNPRQFKALQGLPRMNIMEPYYH